MRNLRLNLLPTRRLSSAAAAAPIDLTTGLSSYWAFDDRYDDYSQYTYNDLVVGTGDSAFTGSTGLKDGSYMSSMQSGSTRSLGNSLLLEEYATAEVASDSGVAALGVDVDFTCKADFTVTNNESADVEIWSHSNGASIAYTTDDKFKFTYNGTSITSSAVTAGTRHQVVWGVSIDTGTATMLFYLDGTSQGSNTATALSSHTGTFGFVNSAESSMYTLEVTEAGRWNFAFTAAHVAALSGWYYGSINKFSNGTFDTNVSGWSRMDYGTISWSSGQARLTYSGANNNTGILQSVTKREAASWLVSGDISVVSGGLASGNFNLRHRYGTVASSGLTTTGSFSGVEVTMDGATGDLALYGYASNIVFDTDNMVATAKWPTVYY
tara:strand:- start:2408 stop:3550 length:1143 start_codon:yes stop_codon:yes gene_type:complete